MNLTLRPGTPADVKTCGEICYDAFKAIAAHPCTNRAKGSLARWNQRSKKYKKLINECVSPESRSILNLLIFD